MDLRNISEPTLSDALKVEGPMVLQIQRIKNVAVPSGKQHDPSPSKRLLRLHLTDGHTNFSAIEIEGPIEKLRYVLYSKASIHYVTVVLAINNNVCIIIL